MSLEDKAKKFFIPKVTPQGMALAGARIAGEIASQLIAEARNNNKKYNPYFDGIDSFDQSDGGITFSELGTPVFSNLTFQSVTYTDTDGTEVTTPEMTFDTVIIDVMFPRNIIKTVIQGKNGTVKEYIGEGDAEIGFRGMITTGQAFLVNGENQAPHDKSMNGVAPVDAINALKKILKAPVPIPVVSAYLQNLDINSVVFEDRTLGQEEGGYSYQTFSINAVQDVPIELQISGL